MQMYALALRTSSTVVSLTTVSLMYAHCLVDRWILSADGWLARGSCDDGAGAKGEDFSESDAWTGVSGAGEGVL